MSVYHECRGRLDCHSLKIVLNFNSGLFFVSIKLFIENKLMWVSEDISNSGTNTLDEKGELELSNDQPVIAEQSF